MGKGKSPTFGLLARHCAHALPTLHLVTRGEPSLTGGDRSGPFVSEHYDGIPAGAVENFLERHGISDWKRVGQGWLNLRVTTSPLPIV